MKNSPILACVFLIAVLLLHGCVSSTYAEPEFSVRENPYYRVTVKAVDVSLGMQDSIRQMGGDKGINGFEITVENKTNDTLQMEPLMYVRDTHTEGYLIPVGEFGGKLSSAGVSEMLLPKGMLKKIYVPMVHQKVERSGGYLSVEHLLFPEGANGVLVSASVGGKTVRETITFTIYNENGKTSHHKAQSDDRFRATPSMGVSSPEAQPQAPAPQKAAAYYISRNGKQYGPFNEATMRDMLQKGNLQASDYVWAEGMKSWDTAGKVFSR